MFLKLTKKQDKDFATKGWCKSQLYRVQSILVFKTFVQICKTRKLHIMDKSIHNREWDSSPFYLHTLMFLRKNKKNDLVLQMKQMWSFIDFYIF